MHTIQNQGQQYDIFSQAMEEDEVVNCLCHHPEGDGMMVQVVPLLKLESGSIEFRYLESLQPSVQCEVCLTWQHGACIGVDCEEQVISVDIRFFEEISFYLLTLSWTCIAYKDVNLSTCRCRTTTLARYAATLLLAASPPSTPYTMSGSGGTLALLFPLH